jgi:hypothetical protein
MPVRLRKQQIRHTGKYCLYKSDFFLIYIKVTTAVPKLLMKEFTGWYLTCSKITRTWRGMVLPLLELLIS